MSRWHDSSAGGIALWANLPLEERIADRLSDILLAAIDVTELLVHASERETEFREIGKVITSIYDQVSDIMRSLPPPGDIPPRDVELTTVLCGIETALQGISALRGPEYDVMLWHVENLAAPDVLSLYYEIRRLDNLLGHRSLHLIDSA